jgi:cytochrome c oxidase subunit 2
MDLLYKRRLLLAGVAAGSLAAVTRLALAQTPERVIKIVAKKFDYTPSVIRLKKNVPVTLEFTALDAVMGFNLPDFAIRTDILPGAASRLRFTPDKSGEFAFHCDVFCGSGHETMTGSVIVT